MGMAVTAIPMRWSAAVEEIRVRKGRPFRGEAVEEAGEGTSEEGIRRTTLLREGAGEDVGEHVGLALGRRHDDGDEPAQQVLDQVLLDRLVDQLLLGPALGQLDVDVRDVVLDPCDVALQARHLDLVVRAVLLLVERTEALGQVDLALQKPETLDLETLLGDLEVDADAVVLGHFGVAEHSNSFLLQSGGAGCSVLSTILTG